jgi:hypothetical protein
MPNRPQENSRAETIVISGTARLPKEMTREGSPSRLWVELELTKGDFEIIDFSCTMESRLGKKILYSALLGHEIEEGIENAINEMEKRFFSVIKRATIAALEDARMSYRRTQKD